MGMPFFLRYGGGSIAWTLAVAFTPAATYPRSVQVGVAVGLAFPPTRRLTWRLAARPALQVTWYVTKHSIGNLAVVTWNHLNMAKYARLGGTYAAAVTAGYVLGALVGTAIAGAIWGDKGAAKADSFYSGEESPQELKHTLDYMAGGDMRHGIYIPDVIGRLIMAQWFSD